MNIDIYKYLQNFEDMDLPNENKVLIEDGERINLIADFSTSFNPISYYDVDGKYNLYAKKFIDFNDNPSDRFITELLSSRLYEKHNINCIRTYPMFIEDSSYCKERIIGTASEDLQNLKDLDVTNDNDFMMSQPFDMMYKSQDISTEEFYDDEWLLLTNEKLRNYFLTKMTPECFEDLVDIMIVDTLFFASDRFGNGRNMFFVKEKGEKLFQSVVPIDLESINFDYLTCNIYPIVHSFIKEYFANPQLMTTAHGAQITKSYEDRLFGLKRIIREGFLSDRQKKLITDILSLKMPDEIKEILEKYKLPLSKKIIKFYGEMWKKSANTLNL